VESVGVMGKVPRVWCGSCGPIRLGAAVPEPAWDGSRLIGLGACALEDVTACQRNVNTGVKCTAAAHHGR